MVLLVSPSRVFSWITNRLTDLLISRWDPSLMNVHVDASQEGAGVQGRGHSSATCVQFR